MQFKIAYVLLKLILIFSQRLLDNEFKVLTNGKVIE